MRSHIKTFEYNIQIGDNSIEKVAIFNCNKLPDGVAARCIETDTFNKYLLTMTKEHYIALFLDDGEFGVQDEEQSNPEPVESDSEDNTELLFYGGV